MYSNKKVQFYCLDYQDRFDIDINILLFSVWVAHKYSVILEIHDFVQLDGITKEWQDKIVKKIRSVRVLFRNKKKIQLYKIYEQLKKVELISELIEHQLIDNLFHRKIIFNKNNLKLEELISKNLKNYFLFKRKNVMDINNFLILLSTILKKK